MVKTRRSTAMEKKNIIINIKRVNEVKIHLKRENFNLYKTKFEKNSKNKTATTTNSHNLRTRREGEYKFN